MEKFETREKFLNGDIPEIDRDVITTYEIDSTGTCVIKVHLDPPPKPISYEEILEVHEYLAKKCGTVLEK